MAFSFAGRLMADIHGNKTRHAVISHESTPDIPFEDKPWVVAAPAERMPEIFTSAGLNSPLRPAILCFHALLMAAYVVKPYQLSTIPGLPRDDNGALEGFHGVVGPDGALYTIWDARAAS